MEGTLQKHNNGEVRVIPIIVRQVDIESTPLSKVQFYNAMVKQSRFSLNFSYTWARFNVLMSLMCTDRSTTVFS